MAGVLGSTTVVGQTREQLRNQMITSMFGRRAGMDFRNYEVGEQDTRLVVDAITTTAASSLSPTGFSNLCCTVASSAIYTMLDAVAGCYKQITQVTSSTTLGYAIQFGATASIITTAGSSFNQITFAGLGHTINLACVSTGTSTGQGPVWIATGTFTSTASGLFLSTY